MSEPRTHPTPDFALGNGRLNMWSVFADIYINALFLYETACSADSGHLLRNFPLPRRKGVLQVRRTGKMSIDGCSRCVRTRLCVPRGSAAWYHALAASTLKRTESGHGQGPERLNPESPRSSGVSPDRSQRDRSTRPRFVQFVVHTRTRCSPVGLSQGRAN